MTAEPRFHLVCARLKIQVGDLLDSPSQISFSLHELLLQLLSFEGALLSRLQKHKESFSQLFIDLQMVSICMRIFVAESMSSTMPMMVVQEVGVPMVGKIGSTLGSWSGNKSQSKLLVMSKFQKCPLDSVACAFNAANAVNLSNFSLPASIAQHSKRAAICKSTE